jgi:hypothetical protein
VTRLSLIALTLVACASSDPPLEHATIGSLEYGAPSGWVSRDLSGRNLPSFEWTPLDNEHKQSITIVRRERPIASSSRQLGALVASAQPTGRFGAPNQITTKSGLRGVRIEGAFARGSTTYHRIHAVLVDGSSLVHVIYTAREPDRETFDAVVDSFRQGA